MLDLTKKLPDTIAVDGSFYKLNTDFRTWLNFSRTLTDPAATLGDFDFCYENPSRTPLDVGEAFNQLLEFYQPYRELPRRQPGENNAAKVLDYDIDAPYIYSAFLERYNIDLFATDSKGKIITLHWHKFLALLESLHDTKLNEIIKFRCYKKPGKNDTDERFYLQQKEAWELPSPEREQIRKNREEFNALFK